MIKISVYKKEYYKGSKSKYPDEFRKQVAEDYLMTSMTFDQVKDLHGFRSKGTVLSFVRWYKDNFDLSSVAIGGGKVNSSLNRENKSKSLNENEMEKLLRFAKLKIETLETMISLAETEFKIDIRKKSGSKPSRK